jgi:hypothetical protein
MRQLPNDVGGEMPAAAQATEFNGGRTMSREHRRCDLQQETRQECLIEEKK